MDYTVLENSTLFRGVTAKISGHIWKRRPITFSVTIEKKRSFT